MSGEDLAKALWDQLRHIPLCVWPGLGALVLLRLLLGDFSFLKPSYEAQPVLNKSEQALFRNLTAALAALTEKRLRLLCQVSYGEFLSSETASAFWKINAKRADFLVVDHLFRPVLVVEYQGQGHFGRGLRSRFDAMKRDHIKRDACHSAGIPFLEVPARYDQQTLQGDIHTALLGRASSGIRAEGARKNG